MPKPAGGLDTPKVRPAEGLMPGLLKLKPELLLLPKPRKAKEGRQKMRKQKYITKIRERGKTKQLKHNKGTDFVHLL